MKSGRVLVVKMSESEVALVLEGLGRLFNGLEGDIQGSEKRLRVHEMQLEQVESLFHRIRGLMDSGR